MSDPEPRGSTSLAPDFLQLARCPRCQDKLAAAEGRLVCQGCGTAFEVDDGIPLLYWPNDWDESKGDVTDEVRAFYEETPFPDYDDFDSVGSLIQKAREGLFAKALDDQLPAGALVLEVGCGTAQLSNFLSVANRTVYAADLCLNSLRLGRQFSTRHGLDRVRFLQMNLFQPALRRESFDVVISNGVLHHTSDPRLAFASIARLVRPGGYILIGLYHRYGRLITDLRRWIFRLSGDRFKFLDPNLRAVQKSDAKKRAWFMDQYKHPQESKHTISETIGWLEPAGFDFVKSIPRTVPFQPFRPDEPLFEPERPGSALERWMVELGQVRSGSREGGFFIVIGRRRGEPT